MKNSWYFRYLKHWSTNWKIFWYFL